MRFSICQMSRRGGRNYNEDRLGHAYSRDSLLMVLADGMGGHLHGEVAAELAVKTLTQEFERQAKPRLEKPGEFLNLSMQSAHRAILRFAQEHGLSGNPGTTCVACVVQDGAAWWGHAGDSRLYLFRDSRLTAKTRDHSLVGQMVERGIITEDEAAIHPVRNIITNSLGATELPWIELGEETPLLKNDTLLLCSDGLWGPLEHQEMASVFGACPIDQALPQLMEKAESRAGATSDNLSAIGFTCGGEGLSTDGETDEVVTVMAEIGND